MGCVETKRVSRRGYLSPTLFRACVPVCGVAGSRLTRSASRLRWDVSDVDEPNTGRPGEWAGSVIPTGELLRLLERFGMQVGLDDSPEADRELQTAQLAHALVGAAEGHATRAEDVYRGAGAEPPDLTQASLMSFAAVNCQSETDELALIHWRATRLAGALSALDFGGPLDRDGEVGSGDT